MSQGIEESTLSGQGQMFEVGSLKLFNVTEMESFFVLWQVRVHRSQHMIQGRHGVQFFQPWLHSRDIVALEAESYVDTPPPHLRRLIDEIHIFTKFVDTHAHCR